MIFRFPLDYDKVSPKARLDDTVRMTLEALFRLANKRHTACFLRIASNTKTSLARYTAYVLDEGVVDSSNCFSFSKFRSERTVWITPNGWRVATIACSLVFVGEAKVIHQRMQFRFGLAGSSGEITHRGEWHVNLQTAFAYLDPQFSDRNRATFAKLSKELIMAVHTTPVQAMLRAKWTELKLTMTNEELRMSHAYEDNPQLDEYPPPALTTTIITTTVETMNEEEYDIAATHQVMEIDPPQDPRGILTPLQLAMLMMMAKNRAFDTRVLKDILLLLEAGTGARMDYLLHFLGMIEREAELVWSRGKYNVQTRWLEVSSKFAPSSLEFRAALFVFGCMVEVHPAWNVDFNEFYRNLTGGLPSSSSCVVYFNDLFPPL